MEHRAASQAASSASGAWISPWRKTHLMRLRKLSSTSVVGLTLDDDALGVDSDDESLDVDGEAAVTTRGTTRHTDFYAPRG
ncbi:hypothetical protein ASD66_04180 [Nocardioides sp. Root151]|nr:hypothetical protein ASD66_04180 [Nocardioides sp. Root151]